MATISAVDFTLPTVLAESGYAFDAGSSVWLPAGRVVDFSYNDGDDAENRLLSTILRSLDVRSGSSSLAAEIRDWGMEYHLSPVRSNLLRPLSHLLKGDTLEIGAGCGALTRYIGELDGRLLAVEGSLRRAQIAAARCKSLENTSVLCDNFDTLQIDQRFDAVVLVGVLEYCRLFSNKATPNSFLRQCRRFLKPNGCLILAIENKLGLKYLCGAPEDHLGEQYFGIEDRYSPKTAVTWGRAELLASLRAAGLNHTQELFPFPDYKLPQLILTRDSLAYGPVLCDLLRQYAPAAETGNTYQRAFSESAAWKVVAENQLVPELSNSFLLVASHSALAEMQGAFVYSSNRQRAFQCETSIQEIGLQFQVAKTALYNDSRPSTAKFKWSPSVSPFRHGRVYSSVLEAILLRPGWQYDEIVAWALPYFELLSSRSSESCLPGYQLDCGPHNLSIRPDGKLDDFDLEWIALHDLPLGYVFFRSLLHCLNKSTAAASGANGDNVLQCVRAVMSAFALPSDDEVLTGYLDRESELQSFVAGRSIKYDLEALRTQRLKVRALSHPEFTQIKTELLSTQAALSTQQALANNLALEIQRLETELAGTREVHAVEQRNRLAEQRVRVGLENSLSWRVTKPLRAAKAFLSSAYSSRL